MPPRDVFTGGPTREQQERLEAQTGGRRGSTVQDRYDRSADTSTRATRGASGPMGGFGPPVDFSSGSGEKAGTLSQQEFMNVTGRTETNPYGNEGFFSRVFGIDPSKINYAANTPGGIATLNKVNALAYDQYLNPRDARGNIRGFLREGSPTRFGTVTYDPTLEADLGIMGALPLVGPLMQRANRRSALNISSYDNPLFSEMGDLGNELGAFPEGSVAAAPAAQAAQTGAVSDVFTPFTTDPEERNFIEEDFEVDRRATDEDSPFSRPVPESTYRPIFTDDAALPSVADVIAAEPMVTQQPNAAQPRLPTGPKVIQGIPGGDPGSASITVNPQSQSPEYIAPDQPIDLLSDILAPDGTILPGVMEGISSGQPRREVDPRTGRIPGTSGTFDFEGGTSANVTRSPAPQFTPEQIRRANENNAATQRRAQLMAQGMSANAAMMQAEREKIRARAARLGLGQ